jgi:uncharacterized membrane protein YfcA
MDPDFWIFFAVGVAAQLVDGALGMAYGVVSSTVLLALGVPPANASASVHAAKVFTGAASAVSHIIYRNVSWKLLGLLSAGGVVGGIMGTYVLTSIDGKVVKPWVVAWLGLMGLVILWRAWKGARPKVLSWKRPAPLGFIGGFFDAIGGGGWGPVVTSNLLVQGSDARKTIGTVNTTEFLVTTAITVSFMLHMGTEIFSDYLNVAVGLIIGGVIAAPIGARITAKVPVRPLLAIVALVLIATSAFSVYKAWPIF